MKMLFSFFLSTYSQCGVLEFLAAQHTTMCLDMWDPYLVKDIDVCKEGKYDGSHRIMTGEVE